MPVSYTHLDVYKRQSLVNGNAMVVATSRGGKSMFVKLEILMLYLRFTKARFYICLLYTSRYGS